MKNEIYARQQKLVAMLNANPEFVATRRSMLWGAGFFMLAAAGCLVAWLMGRLTLLPAVVFAAAAVLTLVILAPRLARMQQEAVEQLLAPNTPMGWVP